MRVKTWQINWHGQHPVFSVDFQRLSSSSSSTSTATSSSSTTTSLSSSSGTSNDHPNEAVLRLATAGGDNVVRIWKLYRAETSTAIVTTNNNEDNGEKEEEEKDTPHTKRARLQQGSGETGGEVALEHLVSLSRHSRGVNCVRFSPAGDVLASAGDDGVVILWKWSEQQQHHPEEGGGNKDKEGIEEEDVVNKEQWRSQTVLRGMNELYDLAWSPDGKYVAATCIDHTSFVWEVATGSFVHRMQEHSHYVQGISWDPLGELVATQSSDRTVRVHKISTKVKAPKLKTHVIAKISKVEMSAPPAASSAASTSTSASAPTTTATATIMAASSETSGIEAATTAKAEDGDAEARTFSFADDTLSSFFRRLSFSPDGSLLVTPAANYRFADESSPALCIFRRGEWSKLTNFIFSPKGYPLVVRFCPVFFHLPASSSTPTTGSTAAAAAWLELPYRMVFAVATSTSVLIYDTVQLTPLAFISDIHYATITDLCWSPNGRLLVVSSYDGYCSVVHFDDNELGTPMTETPTFAPLVPAKTEPLPSSAIAAAAAGASEPAAQPAAAADTPSKDTMKPIQSYFTSPAKGDEPQPDGDGVRTVEQEKPSSAGPNEATAATTTTTKAKKRIQPTFIAPLK